MTPLMARMDAVSHWPRTSKQTSFGIPFGWRRLVLKVSEADIARICTEESSSRVRAPNWKWRMVGREYIYLSLGEGGICVFWRVKGPKWRESRILNKELPIPIFQAGNAERKNAPLFEKTPEIHRI